MIATALAPFVAANNDHAALVFWSANTMEVDPLEFHTAVETHLPAHLDLCRKPVDPHTALTRAMRRVKAGLPDGCAWKRIGKDDDDVVAAYVIESYDVEATIGERVKSGDVLAVRVSKSGAFTVHAPGAVDVETQDQIDRLQQRYGKERGLLTHTDLSLFMKTILLDRARGVRVKAGGANYLIPQPNAEELEGLVAVMQTAHVDVIAVPLVDPSTLSQFTDAARVSLLDEAEALRDDAEKRLAKTKDDQQALANWTGEGRSPRSSVRAETLVKRVKEARELKEKAALYKDLLGCAIADVEVAANAAEVVAREAMSNLIG